MSYGEPSRDERVEDLFPIDGPHGEERTLEAARSIAALVRYLNHATYLAEATPYPSTIDSVTRSIRAALVGMDQLLRQLGDQFEAQTERLELYSDDGRPVALVSDSFRLLLDGARGPLANAAEILQRAGSFGNHLDVKEASR